MLFTVLCHLVLVITGSRASLNTKKIAVQQKEQKLSFHNCPKAEDNISINRKHITGFRYFNVISSLLFFPF
jgi:hypothetical protein